VYKRPEDQYKTAKATEMIEEIKRYYIPCGLSTVKSYKQIDFNGFPHAGTLAHVCILEKGHKEKGELKCRCLCEMEFYGWT
jgi:hypothetical protein